MSSIDTVEAMYNRITNYDSDIEAYRAAISRPPGIPNNSAQTMAQNQTQRVDSSVASAMRTIHIQELIGKLIV